MNGYTTTFINFAMTPKPYRECPRFDKCNFNNCPLREAYPGGFGESTNIFIQKYKSKLVLPFFLILVLISGLIMYLLGKDLKDIISSILLVFIGVVIKNSLDYISKKKI